MLFASISIAFESKRVVRKASCEEAVDRPRRSCGSEVQVGSFHSLRRCKGQPRHGAIDANT